MIFGWWIVILWTSILPIELFEQLQYGIREALFWLARSFYGYNDTVADWLIDFASCL